MKRIVTLMICIMVAFSLAACGSSEKKEEIPEYTIDTEAVTLTIAGEGHESVTYEVSDLEKIGTIENTYSGRNKDVENKRQIKTFTGVELNTLLQEAGFETEGACMKIICSDGYTREYTLQDLYGLYAFEGDSDKKTEVPPMIAIQENQTVKDKSYPSPFRLVYGQQDYDSKETQDFNMQGWATFVQYIEISYM